MKLVREHINFEKPSSEESFRNKLLPKKLRVFRKSYSNFFYIEFINDSVHNIAMRYDSQKEIFYRNDYSLDGIKELKRNFDNNNISYTSKNNHIEFSAAYVDWNGWKPGKKSKLIKESLKDQWGHIYNKYVLNGQNILLGKDGILGKNELIEWNTIRKIYIIGKKQKYI